MSLPQKASRAQNVPATVHLPNSRHMRAMLSVGTGRDVRMLALEAERAGAALVCTFSSSAELDAAIIAARRAAGVYGPKRRRRQVLTAAGLAAGLAVIALLIA